MNFLFGSIVFVLGFLIGFIVGLSRRRTTSGVVAPPSRPLTYDERAEIENYLQNNQKIAAIRRYRQITGSSLKEAKSIIDHWQRQLPLS